MVTATRTTTPDTHSAIATPRSLRINLARSFVKFEYFE